MKTWLSHGSQIWLKYDIIGRQRQPMRALISFTLQKNLRTNMCDVIGRQRLIMALIVFILQRNNRTNMRRTRLLGYSPQFDRLVSYPLDFNHLRYKRSSLGTEDEQRTMPNGNRETHSACLGQKDLTILVISLSQKHHKKHFTNLC